MASLSNTKKTARQKKIRALFQQNELDYFSSSAILKSNLLSNSDKELLTFGFADHSNADKLLTSWLADNKIKGLISPQKGPLTKSERELTLSDPTQASAPFVKRTKSPKLSRVRNICVLSSRARAINQDYKISRNFFKSLSELGFVPGVKKV